MPDIDDKPETIHIIHEGPEPDEVLEVPPGMSKMDYGLGKVLGGQIKLSQEITDVHEVADEAHEIATEVRGDFDARTVQIETVKSVGKWVGASIASLATLTALFSWLMGWFG